METNEMTPERSIRLITDAITKSRRDFEKNAGSPMVLWGILVLVFSVAVWLLLTLTDNPYWNSLWFVLPLIGWPLSALIMKKKCVSGARNFVNDILAQIWTVFGIFATVLAVMFVFIDPRFIAHYIAVLMGFAAAMTGVVLKKRIFTVCGFITGIACPAAFCLMEGYAMTLIFAAVAVIDLLVPGIILNRKAAKN